MQCNVYSQKSRNNPFVEGIDFRSLEKPRRSDLGHPTIRTFESSLVLISGTERKVKDLGCV